MNVNDFDVYNSLPPRYTKNQGVFGKYAASQAGLQGVWSPDTFNPNSPMAYDIKPTPMSFAVKSELMSPASFQTGTVSPEDLLTADNSPLFDEIDSGEMQNWESLFLDENEQGQQQLPAVAPQEQPKQNLTDPEPYFSDSFGLGDVPPNLSRSLDSVDSAAITDTTVNNNFDFSLDFSVLNEEDVLEPVGKTSGSPLTSTTSLPSGRVGKARSPSTTTTVKKVDDLGITVYKRKPRAAPLKPVEVSEESGDVAFKRAKNTEAARRSRARKLERMSQLEIRVRELLEENERLKSEIKLLKGE